MFSEMNTLAPAHDTACRLPFGNGWCPTLREIEEIAAKKGCTLRSWPSIVFSPRKTT